MSTTEAELREAFAAGWDAAMEIAARSEPEDLLDLTVSAETAFRGWMRDRDDGEPLFTREDVDDLRDVARCLDGMQGIWPQDELNNLADRIAALLPPKG